jgi:hypothetical protein
MAALRHAGSHGCGAALDTALSQDALALGLVTSLTAACGALRQRQKNVLQRADAAVREGGMVEVQTSFAVRTLLSYGFCGPCLCCQGGLVISAGYSVTPDCVNPTCFCGLFLC